MVNSVMFGGLIIILTLSGCNATKHDDSANIINVCIFANCELSKAQVEDE